MKQIALIPYAALLVAALLFAARYEQCLPGDQEWTICYGIVFAASFLVYLPTKATTTILIIATLAPLSILGMFFLVNMLLSAATSAAGLAFAAFSVHMWQILGRTEQ